MKTTIDISDALALEAKALAARRGTTFREIVEQGIRHALLDTATSPATQDEAVFMVSACASFASYMWRTHKSAK